MSRVAGDRNALVQRDLWFNHRHIDRIIGDIVGGVIAPGVSCNIVQCGRGLVTRRIENDGLVFDRQLTTIAIARVTVGDGPQVKSDGLAVIRDDRRQ